VASKALGHSQPTNTSIFPDATIKGRLQGSNGYLIATVNYPMKVHSGSFECFINVDNQEDVELEAKSDAEIVDANDPNLQDLVQHVFFIKKEMRSNDSDQETKISIHGEDIQQLNDVSISLKNDITSVNGSLKREITSVDNKYDSLVKNLKKEDINLNSDITSVNKKIDQRAHTETGFAYCGMGDMWTINMGHIFTDGPWKGVYRPIKFKRSYTSNPNVTVALRNAAWYDDTGAWIQVHPVDITPNGFKVRCAMYADGCDGPRECDDWNIRDVGITWIAVPSV